MTDYTEIPFIDYLNKVDDLLESKYGITSNDTSMELIAGSQEYGETPEECVNYIAERNDLVEIQI